MANKIHIVQQRQTGKQLRMTSNLVMTKENVVGHMGDGVTFENASEGLFCLFFHLQTFTQKQFSSIILTVLEGHFFRLSIFKSCLYSYTKF